MTSCLPTIRSTLILRTDLVSIDVHLCTCWTLPVTLLAPPLYVWYHSMTMLEPQWNQWLTASIWPPWSRNWQSPALMSEECVWVSGPTSDYQHPGTPQLQYSLANSPATWSYKIANMQYKLLWRLQPTETRAHRQRFDQNPLLRCTTLPSLNTIPNRLFTLRRLPCYSVFDAQMTDFSTLHPLNTTRGPLHHVDWILITELCFRRPNSIQS